MLDTVLVDYLIKCGICTAPDNKDMEDIIIPTSAVETLIDHLLDRAIKEPEWYKLKRREYQYFSLKPFKFIICACSGLHFFVITLSYVLRSNRR